MRQDEHNTISAQCASIRDVLLNLIRSADDTLWEVLDHFEAAEALFEQRIAYDASSAYFARKQQSSSVAPGGTASGTAFGDALTGPMSAANGIPMAAGGSAHRLLEQVRAVPAGQSRGDLARALGLSNERIRQLVVGLEAAGLVQRQDTPGGALIVPVVAALNGASQHT